MSFNRDTSNYNTAYKSVVNENLFRIVEDDVQALIDVAVSPFVGTFADGTALNPSMVFTSDLNTGIFRLGADNMGFSTGGVNRFDISTSSITSGLDLIMPADSSILNSGNDGLIINNTGSYSALASGGFENIRANQTENIYRSALHTFTPLTTLNTTADYVFQVGDGISAYDDLVRIDETALTVYNNNLIMDSGNAVDDNYLYATSGDQIGQCNFYVFNRNSDGNTRVQLGLEFCYNSRPVETSNPVSDDARYTDMSLIKNNQIGEQINGSGKSELITFTDQGEILASGGSIGNDATNPTYSFYGDDNTGIYSSLADNVDISCGGSNVINYSSSAITTQQRFLAPDGSTGSPTYGFSGDVDIGMYRTAGGALALCFQGADKIQMTSSQLYLLEDVRGTSLTWTIDNGQGEAIVYNSTAETISFQTGSANRRIINTTDETFNLQQRAADGAVGSPSYSFNSDNTTGMYLTGGGDLALSYSGSNVLNIGTNALTAGIPYQLPSYTVASLPTPIGPTGLMAWVSNSANGTVPTYYDGSDWRYFSSDAIVTT